MLLVHKIMNHRHGPRWAAGRCKHGFIKKCTRLVYTTDIVSPGYGSVCHNSTFIRLLLVYQSIHNSNLMVNILLRAFKSFRGKYNIVCIFIQTNHFNTHAIFMSFISQSINLSNFLTELNLQFISQFICIKSI